MTTKRLNDPSVPTLTAVIDTDLLLVERAGTASKISGATFTGILNAAIEANADITDTASVTAAGALMDSELTDLAAVKAIDQGLATTDSPTFAGLTVNGTDLSGVEAGATTDQTGVEIKALYEAELKAFTDDLYDKLDAIEAGADVTDTASVTAAGALMDSELTDLAAVKAIDQGLATTDGPTFNEISISNADFASLNLEDTGAAANDKKFRLVTDAGSFQVQSLDDSGVFVDNPYQIIKSGDLGAVGTHLWKTDGAERMRLSSSGYLGIGTNDPSAPLDVVGSPGTLAEFRDGVAANFIIETASNVTTIGNQAGSSQLAFKTSNSEVVRIDGNGNVGVGTTTPDTLLHLKSTGPAILKIEADSDNATETDNARIDFLQDGGAIGGEVGFRSNTNDVVLWNSSPYNLILGTNNAARVYVKADGDVGIGTSTPSSKLHVVGDITVTGNVDGRDIAADGAVLDTLASGNSFKGTWDASSGSFPGGGSTAIGDFWIVDTAGTVDSVSFSVGDQIYSETTNASTTTYSGNWLKVPSFQAVNSVAGLTGTISASNLRTALNVANGADVTDATSVAAAGAVMESDLASVGSVQSINQALTTTSSPTFEKIRLTGAGDASLISTNHAFQVGDSAGTNLIIDANEIMGRNNGAASELILNFDGGLIRLGGALCGVAGTAADPGFAFDVDKNTGMYRIGENIIGFSTLATERLRVDNDGIEVSGNISLSGTVDGRNIADDGTKLDAINQGLATTDSPTFAGLTTTGFVGINVSSPVEALHVGGEIVQSLNGFVGGNLYFDGGWKFINTSGYGGAIKLASATDQLQIFGTSNVSTGAGSAASTQILASYDYVNKVWDFRSNNATRLEISNSGIDVTGDITVSGEVDGVDVNKVGRSIFKDRADFVSNIGNFTWSSGDIVTVGNLSWEYTGVSSGYGYISDLPGFEPYGEVSPIHFGDISEYSDIASELQAALFYVLSIPSGKLKMPPGEYELASRVVADYTVDDGWADSSVWTHNRAYLDFTNCHLVVKNTTGGIKINKDGNLYHLDIIGLDLKGYEDWDSVNTNGIGFEVNNTQGPGTAGYGATSAPEVTMTDCRVWHYLPGPTDEATADAGTSIGKGRWDEGIVIRNCHWVEMTRCWANTARWTANQADTPSGSPGTPDFESGSGFHLINCYQPYLLACNSRGQFLNNIFIEETAGVSGAYNEDFQINGCFAVGGKTALRIQNVGTRSGDGEPGGHITGGHYDGHEFAIWMNHRRQVNIQGPLLYLTIGQAEADYAGAAFVFLEDCQDVDVTAMIPEGGHWFNNSHCTRHVQINGDCDHIRIHGCHFGANGIAIANTGTKAGAIIAEYNNHYGGFDTVSGSISNGPTNEVVEGGAGGGLVKRGLGYRYGEIMMPDLPTSNPGAGKLWNDGGTLKIGT